MKTIKHSILSIAFIAISVLSSYAQNNADFKTFVELFPQISSYPINLTYEYELMTRFDISQDIPKHLFEKYIFQKDYFVIRKEEQICFSGFIALGKFSTNQSFHLLLVAKNSEISGCGEEDWLITYSNKGKIIDTLFVFGRSTKYENIDKYVPFSQESVITFDSIIIKRKVTVKDYVKIDDKKGKTTFKVYDRVYHISPEGKFILSEEKIKDNESYLERK